MKDLINLLNLYRSLGTKIHVLIRWYMCPFSAMEKYIPKAGKVVDVGCGEGIFSIYLALTSSRRKVLGIDLNTERVKKAKSASKNIKNIEFKIINAISLKEKCDSVIISDVFHHFSKESQIRFLNICKKIIKKNGVFLIKEINKDDVVRSRLSRIWDFLLYPKDKILYWHKDLLVKTLEELGFQVKTRKAALFFPGSTLLYICTKK